MPGLGYADLVSTLLFGSVGHISGSSSAYEEGTLRPSLRRVGSLAHRQISSDLHNEFVEQQTALVRKWVESQKTKGGSTELIPYHKLATTLGARSCLSPFGGDRANPQRHISMTSVFDGYSGLSSAVQPDVSSVEPSSLYSAYFSFMMAIFFASFMFTRKRAAHKGQEASLKLHIGSMIVCGCFAVETKAHEAGNGMFGHQMGCLGAMILLIGNFLRFVADVAFGDYNANTSGFKASASGTGVKSSSKVDAASPTPKPVTSTPSPVDMAPVPADRMSPVATSEEKQQAVVTPTPIPDVKPLPRPPAVPSRPKLITIEYAELEMQYEQELSAYLHRYNLTLPTSDVEVYAKESSTRKKVSLSKTEKPVVLSLLPKSSTLMAVLEKTKKTSDAAAAAKMDTLSLDDKQMLSESLPKTNEKRPVFSHTKVLTSEDIKRRFEELLAEQSTAVIKAEVATSRRVKELEEWLIAMERQHITNNQMLTSGTEGSTSGLLMEGAAQKQLPGSTQVPPGYSDTTIKNAVLPTLSSSSSGAVLNHNTTRSSYSIIQPPSLTSAGKLTSPSAAGDASPFATSYLGKLMSSDVESRAAFAHHRKVLGEGQKQLFSMLRHKFIRSTHFRAMCVGAVIFWYEQARLAQWQAFMPALAEARSRTSDSGIFFAEVGPNMELMDGLREGVADPSRAVAKIDSTLYFFRSKASAIGDDDKAGK